MKKSYSLAFQFCLGAMAMVFAMDFLLPPVIACGVPYAAVVLLSWWLPGRRSTLGLATAGTLLTLIRFVGPSPLDLHWTVYMNRGLSLFIIWSTAALILHRKHRDQLQHDHLEELVRQRTAELEISHRQLQRSQRLASIGTLAAGIAHEVNNPLGLIMLQVDSGLRDKHEPKAVEKALREIEKHVQRCAHIVKSVLRFAREETSERLLQDLNHIVQRAEDLVREHTERHGVALDLALGDELPLIEANPTELEQVMVNVIHNAVHACHQGGCVSIQTQRRDGTVRAIVHDNGAGMSTEQLEHALDPFYTTRLHEGGTGLGLSTCHGIVSQHGGRMAIESAIGTGTKVTLDFPSAARSIETASHG